MESTWNEERPIDEVRRDHVGKDESRRTSTNAYGDERFSNSSSNNNNRCAVADCAIPLGERVSANDGATEPLERQSRTRRDDDDDDARREEVPEGSGGGTTSRIPVDAKGEGAAHGSHDLFGVGEMVGERMTPRNAETTVRLTVTAAACLFVVAGFLTMAVASNYRFIIACIWMVLVGLFVGFVGFVKYTVLDQTGGRRHVFHPAVHAVADWMVQEIKNFREDCVEEYALLMLTTHDGSEMLATAPDEQEEKPRRPKSALFRTVVKPFLNLTGRRRWRRQRRRDKKQHQEHENETVGRAKKGSSYIPPTPAKKEETTVELV